MSDDEKRAVPDTGFRLSPLIQQVLEESEHTDLDDLALLILDGIPQYDRETALFQAVRKLARPMFRPAFIPSQREAEKRQGVEPAGPSPARDGRQWVTADGRVADTREEVAAAAVSEEEAEANAIECEAAQMFADEVSAGVPAATAEKHVQETVKATWELRKQRPVERPAPPARLTPIRPQQRPAPPPPRPSQKVTAIREAWQRAMAQRLSVGGGSYKFLRDCTVVDLERAADAREQHAKRTQARADQLRTLAGLMRDHDAMTLADVPATVLATMSETLTEAAAA